MAETAGEGRVSGGGSGEVHEPSQDDVIGLWLRRVHTWHRQGLSSSWVERQAHHACFCLASPIVIAVVLLLLIAAFVIELSSRSSLNQPKKTGYKRIMRWRSRVFQVVSPAATIFNSSKHRNFRRNHRRSWYWFC